MLAKETIDPVVHEMVRRIVDRFKPAGVILFGSRARGTAHPYSDIDLLVLVRSCADRYRMADQMKDAVRDLGVPVDIFVATPDVLRERGGLIGGIFHPALEEGVVLHGSPKLKKRYPVSEETVLKETRDWLRQTEQDLNVAELLISQQPPVINTTAFLAQQAIEKALKTILIWLQIRFPYTHELPDLRARIPDGWTVKEEPGDLAQVSKWVVAGRYPDQPQPGLAEAQEALDIARHIVAAVKRDLVQHGFTAEDEVD